MAAPISIDIIANTKDVIRGSKEVGAGLDDIADSLDDLTRDAKKAGSKIGDGIGDGAKDAEKATDKLADSFSDLARNVKRDSKKAGDDIGSDIKRGSKEASEGLDEIKDSGKSNAIEVAASFDGSAQSIADGFQGLAAEMFAGYGPLGVVAGVAAAAGIGLISTALQGAQEDAAVTEQRVSDMFDNMAESGLDYVNEDFINESIKATIKDTAQYAQANKDAEESGASLTTVLRAMAGDQDALAQVQAQASAKQTELTAKQEAYKIQTGDTSAQIDAQGFSLDDLKGRFSALASQTDTAAAKGRQYNDAIAGVGPLTDAAGSKLDGLNNKLGNIKSPPRIYLDLDDTDARAKIARIENTTVRVQADLELRSGNLVH